MKRTRHTTGNRLSPETLAWIDQTRKDIVFSETLRDQTLQYHTTWGLFSPKGIDDGTRMLLDFVEVEPADQILDLGCGYGPLGLTLAKLAPQGSALLVDKDFVAVEYARRNAQANGIANAEVILSNGFDQVGDRRFDLIVSNLPAKTGKEQYYLYFYDALMRMNPGARFYVVTITGLRQFVARAFEEVFGNYEKVKQGQSYTIGLARLP